MEQAIIRWRGIVVVLQEAAVKMDTLLGLGRVSCGYEDQMWKGPRPRPDEYGSIKGVRGDAACSSAKEGCG